MANRECPRQHALDHAAQLGLFKEDGAVRSVLLPEDALARAVLLEIVAHALAGRRAKMEGRVSRGSGLEQS